MKFNKIQILLIFLFFGQLHAGKAITEYYIYHYKNQQPTFEINFDVLEKRRQGNGQECYEIGKYYFFQFAQSNDQYDFYHATFWLKWAKKRQKTEACLLLGLLFEDKGETEKAINWYQSATRNDIAWATYRQGRLYLLCEEGFKHGLRYILKAINFENSAALTFFKNKGFSLEENKIEKAVFWYEEGIQLKIPWAQCRLGMLYLNGKVKRDNWQEIGERHIINAINNGVTGAQEFYTDYKQKKSQKN